MNLMGEVFALWLPILVSAVVVFFASFLVWMVLPHHRADVRRLPDEERKLDTIRSWNLPPGLYMWPQPENPAEMKSEAFAERCRKGPWGVLSIRPGMPNLGMNLGLVFLFYVIVSTFVAYLTRLAHGPGTPYLEVFQVAGAVAVLGYCAGGIPYAIFFGKPLRFVVTELIDGIVYGLLTAGVFAWLWPR